MDEPLTLVHVAMLICERQELLDALRELHDFACLDVDYRYAKRSKAAFDAAAQLLNRLEPTTPGLAINEPAQEVHPLDYKNSPDR